MSSNKHGIVPVEPMYFPHSSSCSWGLAFWCFSFLSEITEITEFNILPVRFVAPNWTKSCRSVCCTSAFVFWRNCGCLQSSVLCFGARSMQSCWMPKVQALSNCFLPQANPRARQSSSAPDALYLKSSKWWESHRHLGVKDGIFLSTTSSVQVRAPQRSADTRRREPAPVMTFICVSRKPLSALLSISIIPEEHLADCWTFSPQFVSVKTLNKIQSKCSVCDALWWHCDSVPCIDLHDEALRDYTWEEVVFVCFFKWFENIL